MWNRRNVLLGVATLLFLLGAGIRLTGLESNPPGLWQDEASTGVDALLLWTTGKDRAGVSFPIAARSFGDYPLALYRYLDALVVGAFGLSIATERVVAALSGTLLIALAALLVLRRCDARTSLCFLLVAALSPTWIQFSRYGSEAILMPTTLVLGWLLIDTGEDPKRRWAIWLGAVSLAASAYTYHAVKLFLPLWMIGFLYYRAPQIKELWKTERRHLIGPALLFLILVAPSVWVAFTPEGQARGNTVVVWKHHDSLLEILFLIANNYLSYFDPGMLFVRGGPAVTQSIPFRGIWNLIELPLMIVGLISLARRPDGRFASFVLFWFVLGPLPGGVTNETQNIGRAIGWLPAPQIISACGMAALLGGAARSAKKWLRFGLPALMCVCWVATAVAIIHSVWVEYPKMTQRDWQYEITGAMKCAKRSRTDELVVVSPHFQMASLFATFHFNDLPPSTDGRPAWQLGERSRLAPGEIYLFPAGRPTPVNGDRICTIVLSASGREVSYVYKGADAPRRVPAVDTE